MRIGGETIRRDETHVVVIAMWAVLIALLITCHVFSEGLLALFASKRHLRRLREVVVLRFRVALGTVKPLLAAWRTDGDLSVQDVFATQVRSARKQLEE